MAALSDRRILTVAGLIVMFTVPVYLFWKYAILRVLHSAIAHLLHEPYQHFRFRKLCIKIFVCSYYV
jgi:hypothetical protein